MTENFEHKSDWQKGKYFSSSELITEIDILSLVIIHVQLFGEL